MRWAVYGQAANGEHKNIFSNGRTWKYKHSARNNMEQMQEVIDSKLYLKPVIDDTDRFNVMVEHRLTVSKIPDQFPGMTKWKYQVHVLLPAFDTPREAIDDYIRRDNDNTRKTRPSKLASTDT